MYFSYLSEGIIQNDLVEWYIERNMQVISKVDEARKLQKIVNSVIAKMISSDRNLIVSEDHIVHGERRLMVHPNYLEKF